MSFSPDDLLPENLERMARESQESIRRLGAMGDELAAITGAGQSRGELVRAVVDSGGVLQRVKLEPRAMRLGSEELAEQVVEAVRAAQEDAQRQGEELLAQALGSDAAGFPLDLDALQQQARDIQDSFRMSVESSMAHIDRLGRSAG